MRLLKFYINAVDNLNNKIGNVVCLVILVMTFILIWEVFMRYGFDAPTFWAHEISQYFFGLHFIIGGAYALRWGSHVNVEILYGRLSPRAAAILDLFTWMLFYIFLGCLLVRGWEMAWISVTKWETTPSPWGPPLWPLRLTIPLAAVLVLLQGSTKTIKDVYTTTTGHKLVVKAVEKGEL